MSCFMHGGGYVRCLSAPWHRRRIQYRTANRLLIDKFESWRDAPKIRIPTLLLAAEFDELIPRINTERLNNAFSNGVSSLVMIPGVDHNTISGTAKYLQAMRAAL